MESMGTVKRTNPYLIIFCLLLACAFFSVDIYIPLGVAGGVPYVAVILISLWSTNRRSVVYTALFCSALTIAGYYVSPQGGELWKVLANRFLALFAIWVTTVLGLLIKRAELRIQRLNKDLREHAAELEAANKELESFCYSVSHDLHTPLNAIDGFSRILAEEHGEELNDEARHLLNTVRRNTQNMRTLISDILTFSRTGKDDMSMTDINMKELVLEVFAGLKETAHGDTVELNIKELPPTTGDRAMIRQVIENLLGNAIKFTGTGKDAQVEIGGSIEKTENVYYVKDNGAGFDMDHVHKLFDLFSRLHGEEFEGTGVGLAIVERIITKHGGRVWAEGKTDEGAAFYFTLPVQGGIEYG